MSSDNRAEALEVKGLQVAYEQNGRRTTVLNSLDFHLGKGEILVLLGESGSGKSTIARAVTGMLPPSARIGGGSLRVGAERIPDLGKPGIPWERIRGRGIAMLFQDAQSALNPVMKIKDHFKESLLYHSLASAEEAAAISAAMLERLNFKDVRHILECYPFQLSGGMCQRICLALALCLEPAVLVADEPTSALDTVSQKEVLDLLRKLQREMGLTVLLITHDIAVANAVGNRVIVLNKGVIEEEGDTRTVLTRPASAYTRELLAARNRIARPAHGLPPAAGKPVLEIVRLSKTFGGKKRVLQQVDLTLNEREILGILGQSGCGKSTLAKCVAGLERPSEGRILLRGADIGHLKGKARRETSKRIQLVFQDARASLNPGRTALQLVQEPLHYLRIGGKEEREALAAYYLREVGIADEAQTRRPPQLSTGQCQRIAIARALVLRPDILICDEAVSALDMSVQAQILELLQRLQRQFGFAILMISHDIRVLRAFCHHIAVMSSGSFGERKQESGRLHESRQPHTQLLLKCAGDMEDGLV